MQKLMTDGLGQLKFKREREMEINKTAKLFGLLAFDAFNQEHIKKVRRVLRGLSLIALFSLVVTSIFVTLNLYIILLESGMILFIFGSIIGLYAFFALIFNYETPLYSALSKVSADHLLNEFKFNPHNENSEQSEIRWIAKEDIERNGYFSAAGYLRIKEQQIEFKKLQERNSEVDLKKINFETKYPDVFKRTRE